MSASDRPLLAVCIPTHHGRARPLTELIDRLLVQLPEDGSVELCVSDNASRDETSQVIAGHQGSLGESLRYRRHDQDRGLAENIFGVVEMARAEYCWIMGSDDAPAPEAVPRLLGMLRENPGVSGVNVGFRRHTLETIDTPGNDWAPDIYPPETGPLRMRSVDEYVWGCGLAGMPLSNNVVHRNRWQAVVDAERETAKETPIVPQLYVMTRMVQRDPDWYWGEEPFTLLREAPIFLEEEGYIGPEGPDLVRQLRAMTADVDRVWATLHGRGSAAHRALLRRWGRFVLHPGAAVWRKLASHGGWREYMRFAGFTRNLWRSGDFRRATLPLLLAPTRALSVPDDAGSPDRERGRARLAARVPRRMTTGRGEIVDVDVTNVGSVTLSFTRPYHAVLHAKWTDPETGDVVEGRAFRTPLFPPLRPGGSRRLEQLIPVPDTGRCLLTIDLISLVDGGSLTEGTPVVTEIEPDPAAGPREHREETAAPTPRATGSSAPVAPAPTPPDADLRLAYIDLLKRSLVDVLGPTTETVSQRPGEPPLVAELGPPEFYRRLEGNDWPRHGLTMVGLRRLDDLQVCIESALADDVPGDLIEAGVWRGGAAILMRAILRAHGVGDRSVWVADSFEGLPPPDSSQPADMESSWRWHEMDYLEVSADEVRDNFRRYGLLDDNVCFLEGWFQDTLPALRGRQWAVIRLDGDMYESTWVALESLYPGLAPGGYAIIDDYHDVEECRRAVDEYRSANGIDEPLVDVDPHSVRWRRRFDQASS